MEWKDVTSFYRYEWETNTVTQAYTCNAKGLSISIANDTRYGPNTWFLYCSPLIIMQHIGTGTAEEAQKYALALVRAKLKAALSALEE